MDKTYLYFQPEYVNKFKCDGQLCEAFCCRQVWRIDVDKKTYKKYSKIKPKIAADKILKGFYKNENDNYSPRRNANQTCVFLSPDNLCSIQKKYGEQYLPNVCATFPRLTYCLGDFFERSLTLTCPLAAAQILLAEESLTFEQVEVPEKIHSKFGKMDIAFALAPKNLWKYVVPIQFTAISILQEKSLSIDGRLIILGFFLDKLEELVTNDKLDEIENLAALYASEQFLLWEAPNMIQNIKFDVSEHMKIMLGAFEALYKDGFTPSPEYQLFIDAVVNTFELNVDENYQISLNVLVKKYNELGNFRQKFIEVFPILIENYLVNEFFSNFYPWNLKGSIIHNYGIFATTYKMLEFIAVALAIFNFKKQPDKIPYLNIFELVILSSNLTKLINHNAVYAEKISEYLDGKENIISLMQSLFQGT